MSLRMANTRPCAFHLQNILSRLRVPMHGIVLQMFVFILSNCAVVNSVTCVDCSIRVFTDCSIGVSRSNMLF